MQDLYVYFFWLVWYRYQEVEFVTLVLLTKQIPCPLLPPNKSNNKFLIIALNKILAHISPFH